MLSNTAKLENQPVTFANFPVEKTHSDPYTVRDGRYDFDEFTQRYPHYIRLWVRKHAEKTAQPEDLEDWVQDLLIHLKYLPPTSRYRKAGKEDIIQTFDPALHYGAGQRRFLNYINLCLANKFRTMRSKRIKDALGRAGNVCLSGQMEAENWGQVDDEYCHAHSGHLRRASERLEKQGQDRRRIAEFADFVAREDSSMMPAIEAILATGTHGDAAGFLGIADAGFTRLRNRLTQPSHLRTFFGFFALIFIVKPCVFIVAL
jgi:hypothetical protein